MTSVHIYIKTKMPNPSQEPSSSSKVPNEDLKDVDVLCNFKIKIEGQNWDHDLHMHMVTGLWYTYVPNFGSLFWFSRCQEHPYSLSSEFGLRRMLEVPDWDLGFWSWLRYSCWSLLHPCSKFWLPIFQEHPCPLTLNLVLLRMLDVPDWGLGSWPWFGYGHWYLDHPYSKFWHSILILKVQRTLMSF